jgi:hypothetical protein
MRVTINPAWSHAIPRLHITLSFVLNGKDYDFHFLVHPPCNELKSKSRAIKEILVVVSFGVRMRAG